MAAKKALKSSKSKSRTNVMTKNNPGSTKTSVSPKQPAIRMPLALTKVTVRYDVGFGNALFIRGVGAGLSWEKGIQLRNVRANEWVFETQSSFALAEFKVLINDRVYETGPNHTLKCGSSIQYTPRF